MGFPRVIPNAIQLSIAHSVVIDRSRIQIVKRNVAFESTKVGMNEHLIQYDRFRIKISLGSILQTENTALVTKSKEKLEKNDGPVDKSVKKKHGTTIHGSNLKLGKQNSVNPPGR